MLYSPIGYKPVVVVTTPSASDSLVNGAVCIPSCWKLLTMWKSNTSLYAPPLQPSLRVIGAVVQLLTLTAF